MNVGEEAAPALGIGPYCGLERCCRELYTYVFGIVTNN